MRRVAAGEKHSESFVFSILLNATSLRFPLQSTVLDVGFLCSHGPGMEFRAQKLSVAFFPLVDSIPKLGIYKKFSPLSLRLLYSVVERNMCNFNN